MQTHRTWKSKDVIGIALDLDTRKITFFCNGEDLGTPFTNLPYAGKSFRPALSVSSGQRARLVFERSQLKFLPAGEYFALMGDAPDLNPPLNRSYRATATRILAELHNNGSFSAYIY